MNDQTPAAVTPCNRCGAMIGEGAGRFDVRIQIQAGFDGVLQDTSGVATGDELESLLQHMDDADDREIDRMEEQVLWQRRFVVCPRCRERLVGDPLGGGLSAGEWEA